MSIGRRKVFIASNIFLVLGNIGCALSINIGMLLGFRLTSAIGAAAVSTYNGSSCIMYSNKNYKYLTPGLYNIQIFIK